MWRTSPGDAAIAEDGLAGGQRQARGVGREGDYRVAPAQGGQDVAATGREGVHAGGRPTQDTGRGIAVVIRCRHRRGSSSRLPAGCASSLPRAGIALAHGAVPDLDGVDGQALQVELEGHALVEGVIDDRSARRARWRALSAPPLLHPCWR